MKYDFINNASELLKGVAGSMRSADKEYRSISSVLKDIQRSQLLKAGYREVFAAVGVDVDAEKLTPAAFFEKVHKNLHGTDKKGNDYVGIWGMKKQKDASDKEVQIPVLRKVTSWTPRKVFQVLAQSIEAAK
jgi:hypothetical protein